MRAKAEARVAAGATIRRARQLFTRTSRKSRRGVVVAETVETVMPGLGCGRLVARGRRTRRGRGCGWPVGGWRRGRGRGSRLPFSRVLATAANPASPTLRAPDDVGGDAPAGQAPGVG